ncbi:AraC family transcriptional regulator [Pseudomonas simiae]|uniref:AraC family transcriptional regulator n=1 Tax=Pseudomonas simiae TaxID=321846 RepID=UPI003D6A6CA5
MDGSARYTTANLHVYLLRCLTGMSKDFGIDPTRLCMGLGFDTGDLSNPDCRVSFRQAASMIRRALELTKGRDRGLGLDIGTNETIGSIGLVGYAMLTSPTLDEAINLGLKMQSHAGTLLQLDRVDSEKYMSIRANSMFHEPDIQTFLIEETFGIFLNLVRTLVGDTFNPTSINLNYSKPPYAAHYDQVFRCPIRYEQKENLFTCEARWADKRIATYDPLSHRQALAFLQMTIAHQSTEDEFIESIERIIRRDLRQTPALAAVAAQLCMSDRTLRRRLADQGQSYQNILDQIRMNRALTLLNNPRMTIDEVAYEVGFSDAHNFRRAFKRWTGHGPRQAE